MLAALAGATALGVSLRDAAAAIRKVEPMWCRLAPVQLPSGAIMLRDETNGSFTTYKIALDILARATGVRRVAVVGDMWDAGADPGQRLGLLGRHVAAAADLAVFVGRYAGFAAKAAVGSGMAPGCVRSFDETLQAARFLLSELREGDLALLKGQLIHHLYRIYWAQTGTVECQRNECSLVRECDGCPKLGWRPF